MRVDLYLMFNGNCEEAMNFYQETFDAKILGLQRFGDVPGSSSESYKDKVMHGSMQFHNITLMMSDGDEKKDVEYSDAYFISLDFDTDGDMQRTFDAITTNGGTVKMQLQDTFWGARFGMATDRFGVNWMFNYQKEENKK